jgi:hypothetical protein
MNIQMQTGFQLVEQGMSRALAHVESIDDGWGERAYQFVRGFAALRTQFRTEEVRSYAEQRGLSSPPSARAWDGIIEKAACAGIIERIGFTTCENVKAHRNNVSCWRGV